MSDRPYDIYVLKDPRDHVVRYVGQSSNSKKRFSSHMSEALKGYYQEDKSGWLSTLRATGLRPELEIIDDATAEDVAAIEAFWINWFRKRGAPLLNKHIPTMRPEMMQLIYSEMWDRIFGSKGCEPIHLAIAAIVQQIIMGRVKEVEIRELALIEWYHFDVPLARWIWQSKDPAFIADVKQREMLLGTNLHPGKQRIFEEELEKVPV